MNFVEPLFLSFFVVVWVAFLSLKNRTQRIWLLVISSAVFYAKGEPRFLFILSFVAAVDFTLGQKIYRAKSLTVKRLLLAVSVTSNLGLLAFFKYSYFLSGNWKLLVGEASAGPFAAVEAAAPPLAISFFTFEALSYSIDIYRGRYRPAESLRDFFAFVAFFPHLVSGPIVRASEFLPQLATDPIQRIRFSGFALMLFGFAKKCLLADMLGATVVDPVFAHPEQFASADLAIATVAYAFQIFLDFSGYTDIAVGCARLFGIELGLNFHAPYLAMSFRDFWSRWHISLSTWFRDYVYIPLGGNQGTATRRSVNLFLVFLLSGLWHGAAWKFVVWGALHGAFLLWERAFPPWEKVPVVLRRTLVFVLVCVAWVFFRAPDIASAGVFLQRLATAGGSSTFATPTVLGVLFFCFALHRYFEPYRYEISERVWSLRPVWQAALIVLVLVGMHEVSLQNIGKRAFIYFQF